MLETVTSILIITLLRKLCVLFPRNFLETNCILTNSIHKIYRLYTIALNNIQDSHQIVVFNGSESSYSTDIQLMLLHCKSTKVIFMYINCCKIHCTVLHNICQVAKLHMVTLKSGSDTFKTTFLAQ